MWEVRKLGVLFPTKKIHVVGNNKYVPSIPNRAPSEGVDTVYRWGNPDGMWT